MRAILAIMCITLVVLCQSQQAPSQYHIQTDQGPGRFFRFQTESGQYRKEELHADGSVTGSYGWVDPDGILRLFDYISDAGGYRIEKQRLYKVGNSATKSGPGVPADCQTNPELCFEIYPLDLNSDPTFGRSSSSPSASGPSGLQKLHIVDGNFKDTGSFLSSSLTSNFDVANPVSRQNQATFFESDAQLPPPPPPQPRTVIGAAANEIPSEPRAKPFVIGAAAVDTPSQPRSYQLPATIGAAGEGTGRLELHPNLRNAIPAPAPAPSNERSGVVIGYRNDRRRK